MAREKNKGQVANGSIETYCFEDIPGQGLILKIFFKISLLNKSLFHVFLNLESFFPV